MNNQSSMGRGWMVWGVLAALVLAPAGWAAHPGRGQKAGHDPMLDAEAQPPMHIRNAATTGPSGYYPAQIRHAYGFDQLSAQGAGQKIAILEAYGSPTIQNDLNAFCTKFKIATTTVPIYYPQGKPVQVNSTWALETSLDVEWAHAIAPQASIMLVVVTNATLNSLLQAVDCAVGLGATQVSMSWGCPEYFTEVYYDYHFNISGVTFTAASGDYGAGVNWPAVSPYVIGVGGTTLKLDTYGNVLSEVAWSGSGGGTSVYEKEPAYQTDWQSSGYRMVPDVSFNADPNTGYAVYDSTPYNGAKGWFKVGGTSAGAPQWAAMVALVNSQRATPICGINTPLYYLGDPLMETTYYRDVSSGNNGTYTSITGYDEVTGLGSPLGAKMVPALVTY